MDSSEDLDTNYVEDDLDDDFSAAEPKKPHFLDYDAAPPAEELSFSCYPAPPPDFNTAGPSSLNLNPTTLSSTANDLDKNNASEKLLFNGTQLPATITTKVPAGGIEQHWRSHSVDAAKQQQPNKELFSDQHHRTARFLAMNNTNNAAARRNSAGAGIENAASASSSVVHTGAKKKEHFQGREATKARFRSLDHEHSFNGRHNRNSTVNYKMSLERNNRIGRDTAAVPPGMSCSLSYLEQESTALGRGTWPDSSGKRDSKRIPELGPKVECVYSLLSMLGSHDIKVTSSKFLELSKASETCYTLRRSGCIPLFVQMIHSDSDEGSRKNAAQALHNVVHCHPDDKAGRRESKVLKLIETLMDYCEFLRKIMADVTVPDDRERHPSQAICSLMKVSFDEEHRHAMCQLGALQAIANLVHLDHAVHGLKPVDSRCISLRRYAGMALTNLTFGDGNNKALLCSNKDFMKALAAQLDSEADDLIQVTASVLRNLSWRADNNMITVLNEIGTVTALAKAAMRNNMENTLKAILSALWNLSAHCSSNKAEFCRVDGALAFLVEMLTFEAPSKTLTIIENAGGILRNVSSHIAVREDYRQILRERDCLGILLQQLRSESLTVVSNACGTLWNLSARCPTDQKYLWDNGAVPMLRSLIHSKHKMISNGSNAALKNLLNYRPGNLNQIQVDSITKSMNLKELPSLSIRKQKALEQELGRNLSDTCEILDMTTSPKSEKKVEVLFQGDNKSASNSNLLEEENDNDSERATEVPSNYQETDLDQITNYSLRYAENQIEQEKITENGSYNGNEILLILEDSVKCYETEGTPYAISNATSMTDLRLQKEGLIKAKVEIKTAPPKPVNGVSIQSSGLQTPDKPVNYCEEGTPGYFSRDFSRHGSLSSLEEVNSPPPAKEEKSSNNIPVIPESTTPALVAEDSKAGKLAQTPTGPSKAVSFTDYAQETPLMFSRTSSMESLSSAEPGCIDDVSSVVSEFSRVASGIISPSELPDSPTQSIPHSPRRKEPLGESKPGSSKSQSVFEDNVNMFNVENTPAQFSCATSLSNLSLINDEPKEGKEENKKNALASLDESDKELENNEDDDILATCISIGMNSGVKNRVDEKPINSDAVKYYYTEDTPAYLSKAGSNSDLSVLSMLDTNQCEIIASDESTNGSDDAGNDHLFQECIREGMQKSTSVIKLMPKESQSQGSNIKFRTNNDSLSSLSVDSDDDDILDQAIAAGTNRIKKTTNFQLGAPTSVPHFVPRHSIDGANDSISSIDSGDSNDQSNLLLEQCIQSGMNKKSNSTVRPKARAYPNSSSRKMVSPKKSARAAADAQRDELLLISMGMERNAKRSSQSAIPRQMAGRYGEMENFNAENILVKRTERMTLMEENKLVEERLNSKNENGASVAVLGGTTVAIVGTAAAQVSPIIPGCSSSRVGTAGDRTECRRIEGTGAPKEDHIPKQHPHLNTSNNNSRSTVNSVTINSINGFDTLERSNEYPALKISNLTMEDSVKKSSDENLMMASNEYLMERALTVSEGPVDNKHKDPDLMLKSVDRLTHVLVTTAEYLRAHPSEDSMILSDINKKTLSTSTSTWNENTCPNGDVSFPSMSISAPRIDDGSSGRIDGQKLDENDTGIVVDDDDDTFNASLSLNKNIEPAVVVLVADVQPTVGETLDRQQATNQLIAPKQQLPSEMESTTAEDRPDGIEFKIGGQVNVAFESLDNSSLMSPLRRFNMAESVTSLDLENIQPPSEMEGISYIAKMDSPQLSSLKNRKMVVPSGMMAKRAIQGAHLNPFARSVESINASTNLESVAPPSIMDELLDSMISVDSITSEVVSCDPLNGLGIFVNGGNETTHYETALSDNEDTQTLMSCRDLPVDGYGSSSNCSSNHSTPVKRNRLMTPKLKRQMVKDRYKTYTIEKQNLERAAAEVNGTLDQEVNKPEIVIVEKITAKQRRQENRSRFQTQVLDCSQLPSLETEIPDAVNPATPECQLIPNGINSEPISEEKPKSIRSKIMKLIKSDPEPDSKSVRGKKKADYVSPYRRPTPSTSTTAPTPVVQRNKSNLTTKTPTSAKSPQVTTSVKPGLLRKSTFIARIGLGSKKPAEEEPEMKLLTRQGTFTKDEPSSDKIPVVTSLPATPKKQLSKVPLRNGATAKSGPLTPVTPPAQGIIKKSGIVIKRQFSAPANSVEKRKSGNLNPKTTLSNGSLSQRSSSNASIQSSSAVQSPMKPEKKFPFSLPTTRSNSTAGPKTPRMEIPKLASFGRSKLISPAVAMSGK